MTHREAMSDRFNEDSPITECDGELIDPNTSYSSDVYWEVFTCSKCFAVVFTVEGSPHWWNHEGQGSETRMAHIAELRKTAALAAAQE